MGCSAVARLQGLAEKANAPKVVITESGRRDGAAHIFMFSKNRGLLLDLGYDEVSASPPVHGNSVCLPSEPLAGSAGPFWGTQVMIINPG